ncbi:DUF342 domain-containing protein [Aneurinibacillus migulanus]|uniref:DUF342 domain-containing protein n=1 Tax=Aneurinibacillus migulanus TaxID=47500 RepID=UPI000697DE0F|nr:FapA family protein [Aneurinibacillus migulanus]CEH31967.1 Uncharacterized protein BN1090_A2_04477 [Aneurinibacillus migulanus]
MEGSEHKVEQDAPKKTLTDMVRIRITKDKMQATMELVLDEEILFTYEELLHLVNENRVTFGIDEEMLRQVAASPYLFINETLVIAKGVPPVPGQDGRIELAVRPSEKKGPQEREDGSVDYYEVLHLLNVVKGQLLAKKIPPIKGEPGTNVSGETVPAKEGKEARFQIGKNVLLDQEKNNAYAVTDGQLSITERGRINVLSVFEVKGDVDFSVGNIDFIGNVVIHGNVHPGFTIKAGGDIKIAGSVESATLEAQGSIEIRGGVLGQFKGSVHAGTDVKTGFIQNATVKAENDVVVSQVIMHSNVSAGRDVICKATKGLIVGGTVQAGEKVIAKIIGNMTNTPTNIEVGVNPQLRTEMHTLKKEIKEFAESIHKSDQGLRFIDQLAVQGKLTPDKRAMQIKFTNAKLLAEKKYVQAKQRIQEIEEKLSGMDKVRVECWNVMYSGVKLAFGNEIRFIKENHSRSAFILGEDGQITSTLL